MCRRIITLVVVLGLMLVAAVPLGGDITLAGEEQVAALPKADLESKKER